jgi:hypothetical protein
MSDRVRPPLTRRLLLADIGEACGSSVTIRPLRVMTVVNLPQYLAGGGFMRLMVAWCDQVLHVGTSGLRFWLVYSCWSVGGVAGAFSLPRCCGKRPAACAPR